MRLVGGEGGGRLEGRVRVDHVHFRRLHAAGHQHVQGEVLRGRVLRQHELLVAQVGHGLDVLADHDAVAAVRPVDLLVDAGHDAAVLRLAGPVDHAVDEQRHHVERAPADVDLAGGVGRDHRGRVVDQHQLDAELLAVGRLPDLARLEAVVGQDDRPPAGPDVQGEPHGVVLHRLIGRRALDLRQPLGRHGRRIP